MSVCMVARISQKPTVHTVRNCLCMLPVAVARSSPGGSGVHFGPLVCVVLRVLLSGMRIA